MARRNLIAIVAGLLLSVAASTAASTGALAEDTVVRIGWLRSSMALGLNAVAVEEGFYAKQGITPKITAIRSGDGSLGTQTLLSKDLDFYIGVVSDVARLNSQALEAHQKPPLMVFAVGSPGATHLVVKKSLDFKTVQDIKGLRVGVSSLGSTHLVTFRRYLQDQNTTTEQLGLQLVAMAGEDMPGALLSGQIDAFLHSMPTPLIAIASGAGKMALAPKDMGLAGLSPNVGLIARADWAQAHPDIVRKVVTALKETSAAYPSIPKDRIAAIMTKDLGADPEQTLAAYNYVDMRLVPDPQKGADAYWQVEMAGMKKRGEVLPEFEQKDMFDFTYAK